MSSHAPSEGTFFVDEQAAPPLAAPAPPAAPPAPPVQPAQPEPRVTSATMRDVPLGTLIFRAGLLAEEQLEDALQEGMRTGKRLGEVLVARGLIRDSDLGRLLAGQQGLPYVEISTVSVDPAARQLLPDNIARMQNALSFAVEDGMPVVAVADPTNELVVENVRRALGAEPRLVVAAHGELARKINEAYSAPAAQTFAPPTEPPVAPAQPAAAPSATAAPATQPVAPVEQLVVAQQQPAPPAAPAQMPTVVPPPEERAPLTQPEPQQAPLEAVATVAPVEIPPLHPQAATEPSLAVEPAMSPVVAPESLAVAPAEPAPVPPPASEQPVEPVQDAPGPAEPVQAEPVQAEPVQAEPVQAEPVQAEPGLFVQAAEQVLAPAPETPPVVATPEPAPVEQVVAPQPDASAVDSPAPVVTATHFVVLRLTGGDHMEIGGFGSHDEAQSFARTVVGRITRAEEQAEWPFFADRFLRPQTIVSVDVLEQPDNAWMGSSARRASMTAPST